MNLDQRLHDTALDSNSGRPDRKTDRPGNRFYDLGIAPELMGEIDRLNFTNPTPIQKEAIPVGLGGGDIIAIARTGSGKTLAFGIPMLQRLSENKKGTGLVLVPTRELAIQVNEALQPMCRSTNIRSVVLIGGAAISVQRIALKKNPRIIIATPGRLMDHIDRRTVDLSRVEVFILDEADRMLDMGFVPDIKKIMKSIPDKRQTMLFSATMPRAIEVIAENIMENPTRIETDRSGATPVEVSHEMFFTNKFDKKRLLAVQLKQYSGPVLVFTRTKRMASKLTLSVKNMGFAAAEIHSNRSLGQRRNALEGFKRGKYRVLIATDIAARGIDVSGIELVINYDMPGNSEDYVHRIGRTGRAGKTGHAISFATNDQRGSVRNIERFMKIKVAISSLPTLPTEKSLLKEAQLTGLQNEAPKDEKPLNRKASNDRPSKRQGFKKNDSKRYGMKRSDSQQRDSGSKQSERKRSKRKVSKAKKRSQSADSKNENSFWSNFKKSRPSKGNSAGKGPKRKNRAKRK